MNKILAVTALVFSVCVAHGQEVDRAAYHQQFLALKGKDWRAGVDFGEKLAALPSPIGYELLRDNWKVGVPTEVRQQMFKGFVFVGHPDTLRVLHLGATDPDPSMQVWTFGYLKGIAFTDFSLNYGQYTPWYEQHQNEPLKAVIRSSFADFIKRQREATPAQEQANFGMLAGSFLKGEPVPVPEGLDYVRELLSRKALPRNSEFAIAKIVSMSIPDGKFLDDVIRPAIRSDVSEVRNAAIRVTQEQKPSWAKTELLELLKKELSRPGGAEASAFPIGMALGDLKDPTAIPDLIAAIDSHNSYDTVYGIGYFALYPITGIGYDEEHDGAWWKQWWKDNRSRYPEVSKLEVPKWERSADYQPSPPAPMDGIRDSLAKGDLPTAYLHAQRLTHREGKLAVPTLLGVLAADDTPETQRAIGAAIAGLMGIQDQERHDFAWWKEWFAKEPQFTDEMKAKPLPVFKVGPKPDPNTVIPDAPDVAGLAVDELLADGTRDMRAFLVQPRQKAPAKGFRLLLVLPGGDGGPDFFPFLKRVAKNAIPEDTILVQLVAKRWSEDEKRVVWPQARMNPEKGRFTTEEFIQKTIDAAAKKYKIDRSQVFACGWSSGGPAVWASLLSPKSPLAGAFVAMSVYNPEYLPPAANAKGKRVFLIHSPEDFIPIAMAEQARDELTKAGAKVEYRTYPGGHGWHGDIFGYFRDALKFLSISD